MPPVLDILLDEGPTKQEVAHAVASRGGIFVVCKHATHPTAFLMHISEHRVDNAHIDADPLTQSAIRTGTVDSIFLEYWPLDVTELTDASHARIEAMLRRIPGHRLRRITHLGSEPLFDGRVYRTIPVAALWAAVRRAVAARGVVVYWMGRAAESACAPGGAGRARDLASFEEAFCV